MNQRLRDALGGNSAQREQQLSVFGGQRVRLADGRQAGSQSVDLLINTVAAIAEDPQAIALPGTDVRLRSLEQPHGSQPGKPRRSQLWLQSNPYGVDHQGGPQPVPLLVRQGLVAVHYVENSKRWMNPMSLPAGRWAVHESLFFDEQTERAYMARTLTPKLLVPGVRVEPQTAYLPASDTYIQGAVAMVTDAVRYDDWLHNLDGPAFEGIQGYDSGAEDRE